MHARTHLPQSYADAHPPSPPYFAASSLIDGATSACACMHFESIALDLYSSAQSTPARIKARESAPGRPSPSWRGSPFYHFASVGTRAHPLAHSRPPARSGRPPDTHLKARPAACLLHSFNAR